MAYPAVFWGFLSCEYFRTQVDLLPVLLTNISKIDSVCLALVIAVGSVYSFVLQVPPYNMTAGISGLINVPTLCE